MSERMCAADRAESLFRAGYNCGQALVGAFAEEMKMPLETAMRISAGLGGGLCRMREACGAVSGAIVVLGYVLGNDDPEDYGNKSLVYALGQQMCFRFQDRFGTLNCGKLLGLPEGSVGSMPTPRTPDFYEKRPCLKYIRAMAEILEDTLKNN
ncbi:MAG: C_GCAxxG_C_C family protein [Clostridia bacterium]|nr:C_GCAxxG_C_C family protein [Clostridia bacterium]MBR6753507.1 C_GCAxxG_C_C family protein [Clostridia bacterium]